MTFTRGKLEIDVYYERTRIRLVPSPGTVSMIVTIDREFPPKVNFGKTVFSQQELPMLTFLIDTVNELTGKMKIDAV